jgi:hypothetical protein
MSNSLPVPDLTRHVVVTRHRVEVIKVNYEGRALEGSKLMRPFPTAKVQFVEHRDGYFYVYWICDTLTKPRPEPE